MTHKITRDLKYQVRNIHRLEFELSNNCQYSKVHKWCPASRDERPLTFLKSSIIHKVIDFFKQHDFYGIVYLSGYNEPLLDPRLIDIIKYIKANLPGGKVFMFSNGVACDENILSDVIEAGVERFQLSVYNDKEYLRLREIAKKVPGVILRPRVVGNNDVDIDDRIKIYDEGTKGIGGYCYMPTLYYFVRNNGDVNMCNMDWKCTQIFGNLYKDSIESTIMNEERLRINSELVDGNRGVLPVCKTCRLPGYKCTREYAKDLVL